MTNSTRRSLARGLPAQQRWSDRFPPIDPAESHPNRRELPLASSATGVVGFAGCDSVSSGEVVNRLLVAARRGDWEPRVTLDSQSEPALTRGYVLSPLRGSEPQISS